MPATSANIPWPGWECQYPPSCVRKCSSFMPTSLRQSGSSACGGTPEHHAGQPAYDGSDHYTCQQTIPNLNP